MTVTVRLFAGLRERLGTGVWEHELPDGATLQYLVEALQRKHGDFAAPGLRFAVNAAYAPLDQVLRDGDEVACIPPVGGG